MWSRRRTRLGAPERVLRRRLDFYEKPASYFYDDGRPLRAAEMTDRFRKGMLSLAAVTKKTDVQWLRKVIAELARRTGWLDLQRGPGAEGTLPDPDVAGYRQCLPPGEVGALLVECRVGVGRDAAQQGIQRVSLFLAHPDLLVGLLRERMDSWESNLSVQLDS